MNGRRPATVRFGAWLALVGATLVVLHRAGRGPLAAPPPAADEWSAWLAARDPVVAAVALLRLGALVAAWYSAAASVAGVGVRLVRAERLVAITDLLTVPALRRLVAATAGLTLASGITPTLALARPAPVPAAVAGSAHPLAPAAAPSATPTTSTSEAPRPPPTLTMRLLAPDDAAAPLPLKDPPRPAVRGGAESSWTVRPGECFWSIAADVLERAWNRPPTDAEVLPYWRALIEANRARLGDSHNPDLIFPGQVFVVPLPPAP